MLFLYLFPAYTVPTLPVGTRYRVLSVHSVFGDNAVMQTESAVDGFEPVPNDQLSILGTEDEINNCIEQWQTVQAPDVDAINQQINDFVAQITPQLNEIDPSLIDNLSGLNDLTSAVTATASANMAKRGGSVANNG